MKMSYMVQWHSLPCHPSWALKVPSNYCAPGQAGPGAFHEGTRNVPRPFILQDPPNQELQWPTPTSSRLTKPAGRGESKECGISCILHFLKVAPRVPCLVEIDRRNVPSSKHLASPTHVSYILSVGSCNVTPVVRATHSGSHMPPMSFEHAQSMALPKPPTPNFGGCPYYSIIYIGIFFISLMFSFTVKKLFSVT